MKLPICSVALAAAVLLASPAEGTRACAPVPPPVQDLALQRFYTDEAGTLPNRELIEMHKRATAHVRGYLNGVVREADAALTEKTHAAASRHGSCAVTHLAGWARGDALLGKLQGRQAAAELRWSLAGAALAYLKVKPFARPHDRAAIEAWLVKLAQSARSGFDDPDIARDNHWYWMGLGEAAVATATGNAELWRASLSIMESAAASVTAEGALPMELARQARALHSHAFALMPLSIMAELARARGEDWESFSDNAFGRLVQLSVRGLEDPALFDRLAGTVQDRPVNPGAGWLALYRVNHPGGVDLPDVRVPTSHRWLGGNVLLLRSALRNRE